MAFSKRERLIGIGVGAAVALLALDQLVLSPYDDARSAAVKEHDRLEKQRSAALTTFEEQSKLRKTWNEWKVGVKADPSAAESQALNAILDWAQGARVTLAALRPDKVSVENGFQVSGFHVTGTGSTADISRFIWAIESSKIPVRVSDLQISAAKEGTDNLSVQMNVSTISMLADPEKPAKPGTGSSSSSTGGGR